MDEDADRTSHVDDSEVVYMDTSLLLSFVSIMQTTD